MEGTFDKVAEYLTTIGWQKMTNGGHGQPACLVGALATLDARSQDFSAVGEVILEQFPDRVSRPWDDEAMVAAIGASPGAAISRFNDHEDTTLDDVILVCEKARAHEGISA